MGNMQIDVVLAKLKARSGIEVVLSAPKIAYRETIKGRSQVEGKHKKQSGGHGQYGHVKMTFSPGEGDGLTFTQSVVGGSVPKNYFPAIEKGLQEAMQKGVLAGYPVVGLAADLYDGSYHDVDSNELSFKMAASLAYKAGLPLAKPVLLEPIGELKVTVPDAMVGDVMGDINSKRRGSVLGMAPSEKKRGYTTIEAEVPKATMVEYTIDLRAMTQGKGTYTFYFTRYEEVPGTEAQKIIAEAKANAENED
jgi:elongation factor G